MANQWDIRRISSLIKEVDERYNPIEDDVKEVFSVTNKSGFQISDRATSEDLSTYKIVREKKFAYNPYRLNVGSIALADEGFAGIVSPAYCVFEATNEVRPEYLLNYIKHPNTLQALKKTGRGSVRSSIDIEALGKIDIPLPPTSQQDIVIEKSRLLTDKIKEWRKQNFRKISAIHGLLYLAYKEYTQNCGWDKLENVAPIIRREVEVKDEINYPEIGLRSFGKGTFHKPTIKGSDVGTKRLYYVKPNDLMFSNIFSWEGAIAVAKPEDDGYVGSHRYITCLVDQQRANPHFLCYHFLSPKGMEEIRKASPGSAGRNKTLGIEKLVKIKVPLPDKTLQDKHHTIQEKVNQLEKEIQKLEHALDALVPSVLDKAFKGEW